MKNEFCEKERDIFPKQPINTISSFSYNILSYYCYKYAIKNKIYNKDDVKLYILATFLLGFGSTLRHGNYTKITDLFDLIPIFILCKTTSLILLKKNKDIFLKISILTIIYTYILWNNYKYKRILTIIPIIAVVLIGYYTTKKLNKEKYDINLFYKSVKILVLSVIIWYYSRTGEILCNPNSIIQGHAIWHILTSVSIWYMYFYLFSNRIKHI